MSLWGTSLGSGSEDRGASKAETLKTAAQGGPLLPGTHELNCGSCPSACSLLVTVDHDWSIDNVTGNCCRRGISYVRGVQEGSEQAFHTSVRIFGGVEEKCPVVTTQPLNKNLFMRAQIALRRLTLTAPVSEGDLVMENLLGTGISVIAAKNIEKQ